jgi:uncharacterized protein YndB with AHSA1/START domain
MNNPSHTLKIVRQFKHEPARVFDALTDPIKMSQWFFGMKGGQAKATNDLRPGGKYMIEMTDSETSCTPHGTYLEIVPPRKLVFTWSSHKGDAETKVTIELFENAEGTQLVITHELPPDAIPPHREGWNTCFDHLEAFLDRLR